MYDQSGDEVVALGLAGSAHRGLLERMGTSGVLCSLNHGVHLM